MIRRSVAVALLVGLFSCAGPAQQAGRLTGLDQTIEQAKANGALRCAPRELAMAESHAKFARIELEQGFISRADEHLAVAIPNAHAALENSPPEKCSDRPVVVAKAKPKPGDRDGDGLKDPEDKCPDVPETYNGFQDDDGCPDPDNDGDAILDKADKCPDQPEDPDGFEDSDGCPEPDNDKDGVVDLDDACPIDPGPADNKGCPKKPALVVVTSSQIKITQQIHFEFDKAKIKPDSFGILNAVAGVLKDNPDITLEIQGHTDNKGKPAYNQKLSEDRAAAVRTYLIQQGISGGRLTSKGYGQDIPIDSNATEAGRAKNRRVEFVRTDAK